MAARGVAARSGRLYGAAQKTDTPFSTAFPKTPIGRQLMQVANILRTGVDGSAVYFASHSGYDTSINQLVQQGRLLGELSDAMGAFYDATVELGIASEVTTYTDSEFGRALRSNGRGGSDPGLTAHHLVMGGSVMGGTVYGDLATALPAFSKQDYLATVARAGGLSFSGVGEVFPGLRSPVHPGLGFII